MVSKFHKISTNSKEMEVSYIQYFSREVFTLVRNQLHIEWDGLSVGQRRLIFIHNFLIVPEEIQPDVGDYVTCMNWHLRCAIQVPNIQKAIKIWDCSNYSFKCMSFYMHFERHTHRSKRYKAGNYALWVWEICEVLFDQKGDPWRLEGSYLISNEQWAVSGEQYDMSSER